MDRHGDVRHVEPFHGAAYRELVEAQKPFHDLLFDAVLLDDGFRYIRKPWLYEMYAGLQRRLNNNSGVVKNRTFYKALDTWARRNSVPLATKKVKWGAVDPRLSGVVAESKTTADVIYRVDRLGEEPSALAKNDFAFRDEDGDGWKVSI
jgi:hypothetical protein